jgi:hypothetical protein
MANWCYNTVQFEGSNETLNELEKLFTAIAEKEVREGQGQLPDFVPSGSGWLFGIHWEESVLFYETKWCPNIKVMIAVADHFKTGFICSCEELQMQIYGEYYYSNGILTDTFLDDTDFAQYEINRDNDDTWIFEGEVYESNYDILEILLDRKKNRNNIYPIN